MGTAIYPNAVEKLKLGVTPTLHTMTPIWLAQHGGHVRTVNFFFDKQKATDATLLVNLRDSHGGNLLHFFACHDDETRFEAALQLGCDPLLENSQKYTPFHVASAQGALPIVKKYVRHISPELENSTWLWRQSFDINARTRDRESAYTLAHKNHHHKLKDYLLKHGAKPRKRPTPPTLSQRAVATVKNQYNYSQELNATDTYQNLNILRIVGSTAMSYGLGPIAMALHGINQMFLYATPQ